MSLVMAEIQSQDILTEKAFEIILNFKPSDKYEKAVINDIQRLKDDIKKTITMLPKQEQEILTLRYFQNLPLEKIAEQTDRPKDEVNKILFRGIKNAKEKLEKDNLGKDNLTFENIQKAIEIPRVKQETKESQKEQKQIKQTPVQKQAGIKRKPSFFAVVFSLAFYAVFFGCGYFLIQKYFLHNLPTNVKSTTEKNKVVKLKDQNAIRISGSSSLFGLARRWENSFNVGYPRYHVDLISSDSDKGINGLLEGNVDIANSSRPITFADRKKASERGFELSENRVALDALIIIVNKKNSVDEITLDDLERIFNNEINAWKKISTTSFEGQITPVVREKGSGTNEFVINRILQGDNFPSSITSKNLNNELVKFVSEHEGAISFINSINYSWENKDIKYLKIKNYDNSLAVSPFEGKKLSENAIRYGDYPLAHYLYLITLVDAPKKIQDFVSWVLSKEGQKIVAYSGLIPVLKSEE